jgi:uncharacterized protein
MPFNLFHKKKQQPEQEKPAVPPQEEPQQEAPAQPQEEVAEPESVTTVEQTTPEPTITTPEPPQETAPTIQEQPEEAVAPMIPEEKQEITQPPAAEQKPPAPEAPSKTYLKAMPLRDLSDLENIKTEVKNGNIIILRVTPLASKSIEDVKNAVNDLFQFAESIGGDIARLGEERVVICPKTVRIWREKSPAPVASSSEPLPTAA